MNVKNEWLLWALAVFFTVSIVCLYLVQQRKVRQERGRLFSECTHLFNALQCMQTRTQYPVLRGEYPSQIQLNTTTQFRRRVTLSAFVDTLQTRRLPPLWLIVDIPVKLPHAHELEILVRPTGVEFFSRVDVLPYRYNIPESWPARSILKSNVEGSSVLIELLTNLGKPLLTLLQDEYTKCISISSKRLRYVVQITQASRAHYLVMRNAHFGPRAISEAWLQAKLDLLFTMLTAVEKPLQQHHDTKKEAA